ncbi:unnamed protein product [Ascophyllum nodosum]
MVDDLHWQFSPAGFFLLLRFVAVLANFRHGDVVPMSYKTQLISTTAEVFETPWLDAMRSQMPRFGQPSTLSFEPKSLPYVESATEDKLKIAFAFSHDELVVPRVVVRDKEGAERLERLVFTFSYEGGSIVRVRSDASTGHAGTGSDRGGFDVEYRWDRVPEEDEEAGISVVFLVSLLLMVFVGVDACRLSEEEDVRRRR